MQSSYCVNLEQFQPQLGKEQQALGEGMLMSQKSRLFRSDSLKRAGNDISDSSEVA